MKKLFPEVPEVQPIIDKAVNEIRRLDIKNKIEFIVLYGSMIKDRNNPLSDTDIAIYYSGNEKERFEFRIKAQGRLSDRFDIQIFQDLPLYVRGEIIKNNMPLYYKNYNKIFDTYLRTIREYEDFEKYLGLYYSYIEKDIKHGHGR